MALENFLYEKVGGNDIYIIRDDVTHVIDHIHVDNNTPDNTRVQIYRFSNNAIVFDRLFPPGPSDVSVTGNVVWDTNKNTLVATFGMRVSNPA